MDTFISVLQQIVKIATTIAHLILKIPTWILKLIPGANKLWKSLEGTRTYVINILSVIIVFLERNDWTNLSQSVCEALTFVFQIFNTSWVCDSSWIPTIAGLLLAFVNIVLRTITGGKPINAVKPYGYK